MWLGLAAFVLAAVAEFTAEVWSTHHTHAVVRLKARKAAGWAFLLLALGWVDIAGVLAGLPLWWVIPGSLLGGTIGSYVSVRRKWVRARTRKRRHHERRAQVAGGSRGGPADPGHPPEPLLPG